MLLPRQESLHHAYRWTIERPWEPRVSVSGESVSPPKLEVASPARSCLRSLGTEWLEITYLTRPKLTTPELQVVDLIHTNEIRRTFQLLLIYDKGGGSVLASKSSIPLGRLSGTTP